MTTRSKVVGLSTYFFVLCVGLSSAYAAHPQAEKDMSNDRGSQGNQDAIKGASTPQKGQEKVDETKLKEDTKSARQEFEKNNAKGQQEINDKSIPPKKALQNKLNDEADSVRLH